MSAISEIIETPLKREALAGRYRELCADPRFANLQGKLELDLWGRILMSPASNYHGVLQSRLSQRLLPLGGQAISQASVITAAGLLVADFVWASADFMRAHAGETPFTRAPELCIEISSPSNSTKELREKSKPTSAPARSRRGSCIHNPDGSSFSRRAASFSNRDSRWISPGCSTEARRSAG